MTVSVTSSRSSARCTVEYYFDFEQHRNTHRKKFKFARKMVFQQPESRAYLDIKRTRNQKWQSTSVKKLNWPANQYEMEHKTKSTSTAAKKLNAGQYIDVPVSASFGYRILNCPFFQVISSVVKCKTYNGEVRFTESSISGTNNCEPTTVDSSPLITRKSYDINRRIILAFRLLGIGLRGKEIFCGIMDLPSAEYQSFYDTVIGNIETAGNASMKNTEREKLKLTSEMGNGPSWIVSGDGTWRKRGYSSFYGVSTIIGYYSGKVIDSIMKTSYCKACVYWIKKLSTLEYNLCMKIIRKNVQRIMKYRP